MTDVEVLRRRNPGKRRLRDWQRGPAHARAPGFVWVPNRRARAAPARRREHGGGAAPLRVRRRAGGVGVGAGADAELGAHGGDELRIPRTVFCRVPRRELAVDESPNALRADRRQQERHGADELGDGFRELRRRGGRRRRRRECRARQAQVRLQEVLAPLGGFRRRARDARVGSAEVLGGHAQGARREVARAPSSPRRTPRRFRRPPRRPPRRAAARRESGRRLRGERRRRLAGVGVGRVRGAPRHADATAACAAATRAATASTSAASTSGSASRGTVAGAASAGTSASASVSERIASLLSRDPPRFNTVFPTEPEPESASPESAASRESVEGDAGAPAPGSAFAGASRPETIASNRAASAASALRDPSTRANEPSTSAVFKTAGAGRRSGEKADASGRTPEESAVRG